jgi:hypothetical protein
MARLLRTGGEYEMIGEFGITLRGGADFITRTEQALALLRGSSWFEQVRPYVVVIEQAKRSGMAVYRRKPTFLVGQRTWQARSLWYASAILHDGYHSKLYYENRRRFLFFTFTKPSDWKGKHAEQKCLDIQLRFLRDVGADATLLAYVEQLAANPTYQDHLNRNW